MKCQVAHSSDRLPSQLLLTIGLFRTRALARRVMTTLILGAAILIMAGLLPAMTSAAPNAALDSDEVKRINKQIQARDSRKLKALEQAVQDSQAMVKSRNSTLSKNEAALRTAEKSVAAKMIALRNLDTQLAQSRKELHSLEIAGEELQASLKDSRSRIEALLRAAYRTGQVPALALLLGSEDPTSAQRKLTYLNYYSRAEREKLLVYRDQLESVRENRDAMETAAARLVLTRDQLDKERVELEREQQTREKVVAALKKEVGGEQTRLARLQADQIALSALVKEMNETLARIDQAYEAKDFAKRKGKLAWPLDDATLASVGAKPDSRGSAWKLPAFRSTLREGNGLFIHLPANSTVHSVHPGRIVFADWLRGFGLLLIIDHGDGFMTLYGNNQALYAQTGDQVRSGDIIASSGSSGGRPEAGLYFEIRKDGQAQNPLPWLR